MKKKFADSFNGLKTALKHKAVLVQCFLGAMAVIGGLTFSTILTLLFVPVMYVIFAFVGLRRQQRKFHAELDARNAKRGLWSSPSPINPYTWRKSKR